MFVLKVAAKSHNYMISNITNRLKNKIIANIYRYLTEQAGYKQNNQTFSKFVHEEFQTFITSLICSKKTYAFCVRCKLVEKMCLLVFSQNIHIRINRTVYF
jgi:ribosomal protein L25 (general stress protein Ctc)